MPQNAIYLPSKRLSALEAYISISTEFSLLKSKIFRTHIDYPIFDYAMQRLKTPVFVKD